MVGVVVAIPTVILIGNLPSWIITRATSNKTYQVWQSVNSFTYSIKENMKQQLQALNEEK